MERTQAPGASRSRSLPAATPRSRKSRRAASTSSSPPRTLRSSSRPPTSRPRTGRATPVSAPTRSRSNSRREATPGPSSFYDPGARPTQRPVQKLGIAENVMRILPLRALLHRADRGHRRTARRPAPRDAHALPRRARAGAAPMLVAGTFAFKIVGAITDSGLGGWLFWLAPSSSSSSPCSASGRASPTTSPRRRRHALAQREIEP